MANEQQCPFCPVQLPDDPQMWGKSNEHTKIGGIASCEECWVYAWSAGTTQMMINALHRARQAQATEAR
jgi:hypothetical protein